MYAPVSIVVVVVKRESGKVEVTRTLTWRVSTCIYIFSLSSVASIYSFVFIERSEMNHRSEDIHCFVSINHRYKMYIVSSSLSAAR